MSERDKLARVLHDWAESHDWRSERCDEFCLNWLEAADDVLTEWLPTLTDDDETVVTIATAINPNWNKGAAAIERMTLDTATRVIQRLAAHLAAQRPTPAPTEES